MLNANRAWFIVAEILLARFIFHLSIPLNLSKIIMIYKYDYTLSRYELMKIIDLYVLIMNLAVFSLLSNR